MKKTRIAANQTAVTSSTISSMTLMFLILLGFLMTVSSADKIPSQWLSNLSSFAAGGVGGVCSVLIGHPFDLVKVRKQTAISSKDKVSMGTIGTLREIIATEGVGGMYRGVSAPMVAVAPIWATSFWGFDTGDKLVRWFVQLSPAAKLNVWQLCIAGAFSAFPTALVMVPCERIKCILQTQQQQRGSDKKKTRQRQYSGFADCAAQLYRDEGVGGLFKGTALTLMRDVPGNMVYFGVYELAKRFLSKTAASPTMAALAAGALAGVSFWPVILPMDCLKSRYQTAPEGTYKNIGDVYSKLMQEEGPAGMFNGMGPAMIRAMPANAISFAGAELTKTALAKFI